MTDKDTKDAGKAAAEAAKVESKRADIDAEFREDVAKAAEKRDKALAKLPGHRSGNIAETAWNETKADDDPTYGNCDSTFREKLNYVVQTIKESGNADVVGLEAFEERVKELLAEDKEPVGTSVAAAAKANLEKAK